MKIIIDNSVMTPIYEQIVKQIKNEILQGNLDINDPLPSVRKLARELKISALTVKKAYDQLESENLISTIHGKGSFISNTGAISLQENRQIKIEKEFSRVIKLAKTFGITKKEVESIFNLIMEEWDVKSK